MAIMKSTVITFLVCLLALHVQGQLGNTRSCKCLNGVINHMNKKLIKNYQVYEESSFCPQREIIVETAINRRCLNPESKLGKYIYDYERHKNSPEKKHVVSSTPAYTTSAVTSTLMVVVGSQPHSQFHNSDEPRNQGQFLTNDSESQNAWSGHSSALLFLGFSFLSFYSVVSKG